MSVVTGQEVVVRFAEFELDLRNGELCSNGTSVKLQPQPAKILALLVRRRGETVTRGEIIEEVWGSDTFVDYEGGLNFAVRQIRNALGDDAERPVYVETVPKRGYRFVAPVDGPVYRPVPIFAVPIPESSPGLSQGWRGRTFRVAGAILLAAIALLAIPRSRHWLTGRVGKQPIRSLAVLPLDNFSGDPNQEYFVDGMTDELVTNLAKLSSLRVVSRTSIMQYKNSHKPLRQIASELQVDAVVEGSVVRSGDQVRITAQLIDARDDRHLWAQSYERELRDVLQLQGQVTGDIAQRISSNLSSADLQPPGSTARPLNLAAYDDYLKGRYYTQRSTNADLIKGIEYLERSTQQDPNYAPAYVELSFAHQLLGGLSWLSSAEALPKSKAAATQALALDPNLAEAHTVLGWLDGAWEWNWSAAGKELQRGVELNPNSSFAHSHYALYLAMTGQSTKAQSEIKKTLELDPLSPFHRSMAAYCFYLIRQYDRAIQEARRVVEIDPTFANAHMNLAEALGAKGLYQEGFSEWLQYLALSGDAELARQLAAAAKKVSGPGDPGRNLGHLTLRYFQKKSRTQYVAAIYIAGAYLDLGDKDHALEWLDKAYQEHSSVLFTIKADPAWDPWRSDPRFQDLLRRMNFPPEGEKGD